MTRSFDVTDNFKLCSGQDDLKCAKECYRVYFGGQEEAETADIQMWSGWTRRRMAETRAILNKVDLFIAPSNYLKERFADDFGLKRDKIVYLDYGFPTDYLKPPVKSDEKRPFTFGYIGTHIPAKGINLLIEAFKRIETPAELIIFGRDSGQSSQALKKMAADSRDKIKFAGEYINRNVSDEVFSKVDCIVVPSIWGENSPLVLHEAQACQVPVITADFGGMKEYVRHDINGLLFEHRNADSLFKQMKFAVENPRIMKNLGKRGYLYSDDGSAPDIRLHCLELENIYKRLIDKNRR